MAPTTSKKEQFQVELTNLFIKFVVRLVSQFPARFSFTNVFTRVVQIVENGSITYSCPFW